jgi:tetraprenyl-beta-curcumene synthase
MMGGLRDRSDRCGRVGEGVHVDVPADGGKDGRVALAWSFAHAARRYWLGVFPSVCFERRRRRARALRIPDPLLRRVALESQCKWGNVEGAAAFAAFVPRRHRGAAARAMMCLQAAYNYLDVLGEQPNSEPAANGRRLHQALLVALDPDASHVDYYAHCPQREDGGYLREIVESCRAALQALPSYPAVAPAALRAAERIVEFQSCNTGERQGDLQALERWARAATPPGSDLRWWEVAAAGGSSLCVYALIALAADPELDLWAPSAVADAYFPWIGALHSLLDNLVDATEDRATGQHSLIGAYSSPEEAASRMRWLAERSLRAAAMLPGGRGHTLMLAAMASFYLCTPEASMPEALGVTRAVLDTLDGPAAMAMVVFRARLGARRLTPGVPGHRAHGAELVIPAPVERIHS